MDSPDDLICLTYCSTAALTGAGSRHGLHPEIARILFRARRFNRRAGIGGVLQFGNGCFFQYLEGPTDTVDSLYARICRDARHRDVRRITRRPIATRRFEGWSMKFVALERSVTDVLRRHQLAEYDPYRFTPAIVDDLVVRCVGSPERAPEADPDSAGSGQKSRRGLWQRLTGR